MKLYEESMTKRIQILGKLQIILHHEIEVRGGVNFRNNMVFSWVCYCLMLYRKDVNNSIKERANTTYS